MAYRTRSSGQRGSVNTVCNVSQNECIVYLDLDALTDDEVTTDVDDTDTEVLDNSAANTDLDTDLDVDDYDINGGDECPLANDVIDDVDHKDMDQITCSDDNKTETDANTPTPSILVTIDDTPPNSVTIDDTPTSPPTLVAINDLPVNSPSKLVAINDTPVNPPPTLVAVTDLPANPPPAPPLVGLKPKYFPNLIDPSTGLKVNDWKSSIALGKDIYSLEVRIVCHICSKRYPSMELFKSHHQRRHPKKSCGGLKYRKLSYRRLNTSSSSGSLKPIDKINDRKLMKEPKSKKVKKSKTVKTSAVSSAQSTAVSSVTPKTPILTPKAAKTTGATTSPTLLSVLTSSGNLDNYHFRHVPQCKICTFTPLVNPYHEIDSHIRHEHKISTKIGDHYDMVTIKSKTNSHKYS